MACNTSDSTGSPKSLASHSRVSLGDVFQCHCLKFSPPPHGRLEGCQRRLDSLTPLGKAVKIPGSIEIVDRLYSRRIVLRLKISPGSQLRQCEVEFFDTRRSPRPSGFGQNLVRSQLEPVLPLSCGKDIHDDPIKFSLIGTYVPEQIG